MLDEWRINSIFCRHKNKTTKKSTTDVCGKITDSSLYGAIAFKIKKCIFAKEKTISQNKLITITKFALCMPKKENLFTCMWIYLKVSILYHT